MGVGPRETWDWFNWALQKLDGSGSQRDLGLVKLGSAEAGRERVPKGPGTGLTGLGGAQLYVHQLRTAH